MNLPLLGIMLLAAGAAFLAFFIAWAAQKLPAKSNDLVAVIDGLLPQTQCAVCGYPGCKPYAQAVAEGKAAINLCAPGGVATVAALAQLLGEEEQPLAQTYQHNRLAVIDELNCVGCMKCVEVCPVDAIVGTMQRMHTVIAQECTGCELCIEPCPMDCISLIKGSV